MHSHGERCKSSRIIFPLSYLNAFPCSTHCRSSSFIPIHLSPLLAIILICYLLASLHQTRPSSSSRACQRSLGLTPLRLPFGPKESLLDSSKTSFRPRCAGLGPARSIGMLPSFPASNPAISFMIDTPSRDAKEACTRGRVFRVHAQIKTDCLLLAVAEAVEGLSWGGLFRVLE